ncbi:MAG: hypothetical protein QM800_07650 [Paludibacter sp.]
MLEELPSLRKMIITHYQCADFTEGTPIHNMHVYVDGKVREFSGSTEAVFIRRFSEAVNHYQGKGYRVVHWGQNRTHYGPDHIVSRYHELTGETIILEYENDINMSDWLKERYGFRYVKSNAKMDALAKLNNLHGSWEEEGKSRVFATNRILLIKNIYMLAHQDKLIVGEPEVESAVEFAVPETVVRCFSSYLIHADPPALALALKEEFCFEKGKEMRLLIEALCRLKLLKLSTGQNRQLYHSIQGFFGRNICHYNSVFGYKINDYLDKKDIGILQARVGDVLERIPVANNPTVSGGKTKKNKALKPEAT